MYRIVSVEVYGVIYVDSSSVMCSICRYYTKVAGEVYTIIFKVLTNILISVDQRMRCMQFSRVSEISI